MTAKTDTDETNGIDRAMNRRQFIRTVGVTAGSAAVVGSGSTQLGLSPVEESEAFWPAVGAGIAIGTGVTWTLAEIGVIGSDAPPDTIGPEALKDQIGKTIRTRKSTNQSTLLDNNNIVSYVEEPAFADGKVAAVEAINNDKTKSEVVAEGEAAVNEHIATVEQNLLKTWNESLSELSTMLTAINDAGLSLGNLFVDPNLVNSITTVTTNSREISLSNGKTLTVKSVYQQTQNNAKDTAEWDPTEMITYESSTGGSPSDAKVTYAHGNSVGYLAYADWNGIWTGIQDAKQNVLNNLSLWVDEAYSALEAGVLNPDELLTPTDLADQYAGENVRAVADLQALGIPNAGTNEAEIQVSDEYNTRMAGMLANTAETEISAGDVIDPNATDGQGNPVYGEWYISHNLADWQATVTQYFDTDYGIQGGNLRATRNPNQIYGNQIQGITYQVETTTGEIAEIPVGDFTQTTDGNGNTIWTADIVDQLSTTTTGYAGVTAFQTSDETRYQTEPINNQFEVLDTSDDNTLTIDPPREPQTDSNYITADEWEQFRQNTQENIDAYQEQQSVIGGGGNLFGGGGLPSLPGFGFLESAVLVILGLFGLNAATN